MEEMERYGDYNEVDEAPGGNRNPVVTLIKILIVSLCVLVIGILAFRVILFNYYPKEMKNIYFNDELSEYYASVDGEIGALTQTLRAPYDDPDYASFMADNLIVVRDAGQIQISLRYNSSVFDTIEQKYGVRLDNSMDDLFTFELEHVPFGEGSEAYKVGELDYSASDEFVMYTYYKLVFDGLEFTDADTYDWIRLKITLNGVPKANPYYILIYDNAEDAYPFEEYKLSGKEHPNG